MVQYGRLDEGVQFQGSQMKDYSILFDCFKGDNMEGFVQSVVVGILKQLLDLLQARITKEHRTPL